MAGKGVGREGGREGREGEGKGKGMWRGPECGLPRGPRWLSAGLAVPVVVCCCGLDTAQKKRNRRLCGTIDVDRFRIGSSRACYYG